MAWVSAFGGSLMLAASVGAGCSFSADFSGGRFACDSLTPCPDGIACVDGYCQAPSAGDGSDGDGTGDAADPDAGSTLDLRVSWRDYVVGSVDNGALESVTTEQMLSGDAGDLYLAFISLKPPRFVQSVSGLGLAWTAVRQQCSGRETAALALYWALAPQAGSGKVTASLAGAADGSAVISVHRYSGANPVEPLGDASWANTNGNDSDPLPCSGGVDTPSYSWSSLDVGSAGSIVVSGAHTANYPSHEPGDDFNERSDDQSGDTSSSAGVAVQQRRLDDPTTNVRVSGSWENAPDWAVIAVELRD